MINRKSLETVKKGGFSKFFCRPLYESYCFSQIPKTIENLFTGDRSLGLPPDVYGNQAEPIDHVVVLFLDAFGWTFYEKYKDQIPFLKKAEKDGILSKITSMFPSTTAAHVTCINTGLTPSQSGLYEWFIYEPTLNDLIAPLPFSFAGDHKTGSLGETALSPKHLYPSKTLYHRLTDRGVRSIAFQPQSICDSPYTKSVFDGAKIVGYSNAQEAFGEMIQEMHGKSYTYFYFGEIDAIGHRKGIHSDEFFGAIQNIFVEIEKFVEKLPPKTALILTADHGMVDVDPKKTYYLNKKMPSIEKYLKLNRNNKPLAPAGSCRDFFLHVRPESCSELKDILQHFLGEIAEVYFVQQLVEEQFFGLGRASENFLSRVGDLVILPYKGEAVWWFEKHRFQQNFFGAHGGLTREEMEIPFLFLAN